MRESRHECHADGGTTKTSDSWRDPVCGMTVPEDGRLRVGHGSATYVFCSEHCLQEFQSDPDRYVSGSKGDPTRSPPERGTTYVCPMDADVRQDAPGSCPKCGMALEPQVISPLPTKTEYVCPMHPEIVRSEPGSHSAPGPGSQSPYPQPRVG